MALNLDEWIERLKRCECLKEDEVKLLCDASIEILIEEANVQRVDSPVTVCGDIHGQFYDLCELFKVGGDCPGTNYLFMGDFVDRGYYSVETFLLLLSLKLRYPDRVTLIRGNHESRQITQVYGFYDECKRRYSVKLWRIFADCFNCMPVAAVVEDKILCMHGGLSPDLDHLSQIFDIPRPTDVPDEGLLCDLLWADPDLNVMGWGYNARYIYKL